MPQTLSDEIKSFLDLVYEMRQAQKDYFSCRDSKRLKLAKNLEGNVDKALRAIKQGEALGQ